MSANPNPFRIIGSTSPEQGSRELLSRESSNEFVFAVVGHAGAGTSVIANALVLLLGDTEYQGEKFDVVRLSAREVITSWALAKGLPIPPTTVKRYLKDVKMLQDYGDKMRAEVSNDGTPEHAAVARGLVELIQKERAARTGVEYIPGTPVMPDRKPRAYVLDSIRHPAEVQLLRNLYGDAFVLIGIVCEEEKRITRMQAKYEDCGKGSAKSFMERDADDAEKHGQHVADAFHLADFFVDNTTDREIKGASNEDWKVNEELNRLVKVITHSELVRPGVQETAMYHAYSAQMQSACLSRQVGAAVVDVRGNVVATGTNEVPKAGGGVYGEAFEKEEEDSRCGFFKDPAKRYCRNTQQQNMIIDALLDEIPELKKACEDKVRREALKKALRKTRIGGLLEFSRAVHAEMDALLSAARTGVSLVGCRLFVTTYPCHYCARHIVAAGIDEVQYIEPYPKSEALSLHPDSIAVEGTGWVPPSQGGSRVLFRPFSGVAPRLYERAFLKVRELKVKETGRMQVQKPEWVMPWHLASTSYVEIEAKLSRKAPANGQRE
jgi:deoxycytidylate deaminase